MCYKNLLSVLLLILLITQSLSAQLAERISTFANIKGDEDIEHKVDIPMKIVKPVSGFFDPMDMKDSFPELDIDSSKISMTCPDLKGYIDTIFIMMFIRDKAYSERGVINIVIIGVRNNELLDYFIDNNCDNIYSDTETRFSFTPSVEKIKLDIEARGGSNEFYLFNPVYIATARTIPYINRGSWDSHANRSDILTDFSLSFGTGSCSLSYTPDDPVIESQEYNATIFASGLVRAGIVGRLRRLNIGLYAGFQQVEYSDRIKISYKYDNTREISYMQGHWNRTNVSAEIAIEYDFYISEIMAICPTASAGLWTAVGLRAFDESLEPPVNANYKETYRYDLGLKIKLLIDNDSFISFRTGIINSYINAKPFLTNYQSDYSLSYHQLYLGISYTFRLKRGRASSNETEVIR